MASGKEPKAAFAETFQTDSRTLETELRKYVGQKKFGVTTTDFEGRLIVDAETTAAPVSAADAKAILGDLLYHARRFDEAAAHLEQALRLDPNSASANMTLGLVRMKQEKFSEAKRFLKRRSNSTTKIISRITDTPTF